MFKTIVIGILLLSLGASAQYKSVFTRESVVSPDTIQWYTYQLYACDSLGQQITNGFNPKYQKLEIEINFHNMGNPTPKERQAFFEYVANQICLNKYPRYWLNVRTKSTEYYYGYEKRWSKYMSTVPRNYTKWYNYYVKDHRHEKTQYYYDSKYDKYWLTPKKK